MNKDSNDPPSPPQLEGQAQSPRPQEPQSQNNAVTSPIREQDGIIVLKAPPHITADDEDLIRSTSAVSDVHPRKDNKYWDQLRELYEHHQLLDRLTTRHHSKKARSKKGAKKKDDESTGGSLIVETDKKKGGGWLNSWWATQLKSCWSNFNKTCCVTFQPALEDDEADTDEPWMFEPRSRKEHDFVEKTYNMYCRKRVRPTHIEARAKLLVTLRVCLQAATHLHVNHLLCKETIRTLTYSNLYIPTPTESDLQSDSPPPIPLQLDPELISWMKGKTILGSYIWLFACGLHGSGPTFNEHEQQYFRSTLATLMGDSLELSAAICHVTATADFCLDELDFAIARHMFTLHGVGHVYNNEQGGTTGAKPPPGSQEGIDRLQDPFQEYELAGKELRRLYHRHRALKKRDAEEKKRFIESRVHEWKPSTRPTTPVTPKQVQDDSVLYNIKASAKVNSRGRARTAQGPTVRVLARFGMSVNNVNKAKAKQQGRGASDGPAAAAAMEEEWQDVDSFPHVARINLLIALAKRLRTLIKQTMMYLQKIHRTLVSRPRKLNLYTFDGHELAAPAAANVFEAALQLKEALDKQHEFPNWLLTHKEAGDLREVGLWLLDRVDELRARLFVLRQLGREVKYVYRLAYEYIEKSGGLGDLQLKSYGQFAPEMERKWFTGWAHSMQFKAWEGEPAIANLRIRNVRSVFTSCGYASMLAALPVKLNDLELKTEMVWVNQEKENIGNKKAMFRSKSSVF